MLNQFQCIAAEVNAAAYNDADSIVLFLCKECAAAIDKLELPEMLGTLAGDDTCVVIMRDNASAATFCAEIREQIEV